MILRPFLLISLVWIVVYWLGLKLQTRAQCGRQLNVSLASVTWTTTALNEPLLRWRRAAAKWQLAGLKIWFTIGAVYAGAAMVGAMVLLMLNIYYQLNVIVRVFRPLPALIGAPHAADPSLDPILTPVLPGVNLPISHVFYFVLAIGLNAVAHELGHAVAAVCEGVRVNAFGVFLSFMYPGAFCDINAEDVQAVPPFRRLRIFAAGVLHNAALALISLFCMYLAVPLVLDLVYARGLGAVVVDVHPNSPIRDHLPIGSVILRVNGHNRLYTAADWYGAMARETAAAFTTNGSVKRFGYCTSVARVEEAQAFTTVAFNGSQYVDCCGNVPDSGGPSRFCFTYGASQGSGPLEDAACLDARDAVDNLACSRNDDCTIFDMQDKSPSLCVFPHVPRGESLIKVEYVVDGGAESFLLYTGDPRVLDASVYATDHAPRHPAMPLKVPQRCDTFLRYMVALSVALSLLNVVPSFRLDGQYVIGAALESIGQAQWEFLCVFTGTALIAGNVLFAFIILFVK